MMHETTILIVGLVAVLTTASIVAGILSLRAPTSRSARRWSTSTSASTPGG